jgi:hypothetical protein
MSALVVGSFILLWDWAWITIGGLDQYSLGFTHLAISLWGVAIGTVGLKRILGVPAWLGVLLNLLTFPIAVPFGIMFMRSPL